MSPSGARADHWGTTLPIPLKRRLPRRRAARPRTAAPGADDASPPAAILEREGPARGRPFGSSKAAGASLHHPAHVGHAGTDAGTLLLRSLGDDRLGGEDVLRNRRGVLQRRARDHRRVDDARAGQVLDLAGVDVEAAALLGLGCVQQRDAAARHDALLEGSAGGLERVLDAVLLLLHLGLCGRADLHDGDTARELREALLELLAIEVGVGVLDLRLDLVDAALDRVGLAGAVDDRRGVLREHNAAGATELRELRVLELEAHLLGDDLAAGQERDVLEHALAAG